MPISVAYIGLRNDEIDVHSLRLLIKVTKLKMITYNKNSRNVTINYMKLGARLPFFLSV